MLACNRPGPHTRDWTTGPAKFFAVAILGCASLFGLAWAVLGAAQPPILQPAARPAPLHGASSSAGSTAASPDPSLGRRININTASVAELEVLPGIGPALARRIVDDRTASGPFASLDHLDRVKGIGPRTIEKLRPLATTN
jgi:competence protein ComEA